MNAIVYDDELGTELERVPIPDDMKELAEEYRVKLIESVAEYNDKLLEKYFDGEEIERDELIAAMRQATINLDIVPVICGSSYRNKGVQPLLDCIVDFMPSPLDIPPVEGKSENGETEVRKADDDEPFSALAFKIMSDPFVGKLAFVRIYSGTLTSGSTIYNSTKGKRERMGRLLRMHANAREDVETLYAGDIAAVVGPRIITTGDTLCDDKYPILLETMDFPEPVIEVAIEPELRPGRRR